MACLVAAASAHEAGQADEGTSEDQVLVIATRHVPPFAIRQDDGSWSGMSIELWREIAAELDLQYELQETTLKEMVERLQAGSVDAAVAALTVTAEREEIIDFTHPFHTSGLGIAVQDKQFAGWKRIVKGVLSATFLKAIAALGIVLLVMGFLVWLFERRRNPDQFGGSAAQGIGSGFWWSAVTLTTVGYGDKAPRSLGGRFVAIAWMLASILIISSFTAAIASALLVSQLESHISGPEDLPGLTVASVPDSTSEAYLRKHHIGMSLYDTHVQGLQAVIDGEIDAMVYDAPVIRFLVRQDWARSLQVVPRTFEAQNYAIALPEDSSLREPINRVLLRKIATPWWQDVLYRYLEE